jgi:pimeloyl-ACP methyl ester carboxylesterase
VLLAAFAPLVAAPDARAALRFERCGDVGFACARLSVPLDRAGNVPGRVPLLVKRLRSARKPRRGATFVLAGGPGQSATDSFDVEALAGLFPAYRTRDLIAFDQRGTGRSAALRCPRLERSNLLHAGRAAADCARRLGPGRAFYTTRESVEDIEAVRRQLGVPRIALFGTSYGSKVALAYSRRYPRNVERLVLDSVVLPDGPDPLYRDTLAAAPRVLRALCRARCAGFTRDPVADLERLVRRLGRGELRGRVIDPRGRSRRASLSRAELFAVLTAGDLDPSLRAAFPAAVRSALRRDPAALLRLKRRALAIDAESPPPRVLSAGLYAATTCEELPFPWPRMSLPADRPRRARAAAEAIPASAFRPFDRSTALETDLLALCRAWPTASAPPAAGGPLPDVPALVLAGEDDLRTPLEGARQLAARFAHGRLLVARATGHSVLGSDRSGCAERAFRRFFAGRAPPSRCPRARRRFRPGSPAPTSLRRVRRAPGVRGLRGRTVGAVALALRDVAEDSLTEQILRQGDADVARGGGLRGGRYRIDARGTLVLRGVVYVSGVRVSGRIRRFGERRQRGRLRVRGRAAPDGVLSLRGGRVRGRLGGRRVRGRLRPVVMVAGRPATASRLPGPAPR